MYHFVGKVDNASDEDDDTEYFRQEVGEEPDEGIRVHLNIFFYAYNTLYKYTTMDDTVAKMIRHINLAACAYIIYNMQHNIQHIRDHSPVT